MRGALAMRVGWIFEAVVSAAILAFGIVVMLLPVDGDALLLRADGLALIGLGLFGGLIAIVPFRRGERWAWWALWFYPMFWTGAARPPSRVVLAREQRRYRGRTTALVGSGLSAANAIREWSYGVRIVQHDSQGRSEARRCGPGVIDRGR